LLADISQGGDYGFHGFYGEVIAISQSSVKVKCIEKHDEWEQWIDPALITDVIS